MPSFNRVTLMGNLTRDPQVKQLPTTTVAEFGLAMSRRYKASDGEDREEVCFVDCAAFGKQAEVIAQYCTKGRPLFVEGRLKFDAWDDRSGQKRSKVTVVVENFQFLGARGEDGGTGAAGGATADHGRAGGTSAGNPDDLPAGHGRRGAPRGERAGTGAGAGDRAAAGADKARFAQADIPF
jgi:single-strand DNA-binding protein